LAAVLRTRDERCEVERVDLLVLQQLRHLVRGDARGEAFDDGGLADAGLADQHRVVLRTPREDLHQALDLGLAADHGVELALGVNGICPLVTSSPWPTMRATCARTSSTVMSRDSSTRAARPSSSRSRPSRMCSVPM